MLFLLLLTTKHNLKLLEFPDQPGEGDQVMCLRGWSRAGKSLLIGRKEEGLAQQSWEGALKMFR